MSFSSPVLNSNHRCDSCGARAYVHVIIETGVNEAGYQDSGELFFCVHHSRESIPVMKARCNIVHLIDESRFLAEHVKDDHWVEGRAGKP